MSTISKLPVLKDWHPADNDREPVKNWEDRWQHLPTPDFEAPELLCDTELWQDNLLDPNIPKPDTVFKYKDGREGSWVELKSIGLRVLAPLTEANANPYLKVILP
ncbi:uncharacterized protein N7483_000953 [Penicillium malachiteum]|uniref:uncharacterized protein n=1 Tax=Penicillium malachiteum TaxID=1324776 RepID=UPI002546BFA2|nr:uncharacterized protein N7483_000953 [Penicillium malachiteum]KAJ5735828.1 hypothetical protein N7483_000953 [Penicillium malachiteum]